MIKRNLAIATANGFKSTPKTPSNAFCTATMTLDSSFIHNSNNLEKPPNIKWPLPQVGSIMRTFLKPNSWMAGLRVLSRMNSSTKSGVCSRAYFLRARSERSWYKSPKNRVSLLGTTNVLLRFPVSGSTSCQNCNNSLAQSPLGPTAHKGVLPSANKSLAAGIFPTSVNTCRKYSRSETKGFSLKYSSWVFFACLIRSLSPLSQVCSINSLSSKKRTNTQLKTHATAT